MWAIIWPIILIIIPLYYDKGGSINLFPDGAWSRIGGVGASTSCWGTGGGMEQKLTLTGLTRLRTSVETVARKADGWSGGGPTTVVWMMMGHPHH